MPTDMLPRVAFEFATGCTAAGWLLWWFQSRRRAARREAKASASFSPFSADQPPCQRGACPVYYTFHNPRSTTLISGSCWPECPERQSMDCEVNKCLRGIEGLTTLG